ncbi:DNA-protecting protein DprA [Candidatus Wolfebacteria bacterium]|nr:DNA-protecting protein DprA [Candidatus Wolfebacteria bacterium]
MPFDVYQVLKKDFPGTLGHIPDPPGYLYVRGTLPPKDHKLLCIVGSRALSDYGRRVLTHFFNTLQGHPISIVSGLALGTDGLAHTLALKHGLHTIGVPGSGISDEAMYPKTHARLAQEILESGGALLSEYPPEFRAQMWSFPKRNRIMAGMSDAVFMLEAGEKSGTLITAKMSSEYNKELLTIPHPLFSEHGKGPHQFLRLGATIVTKPEHILEVLGLDSSQQNKSFTLHPLEKKLYDILREPKTLEQLILLLGLSRDDLLQLLSSLELKEIITVHGGAYVRLRTQLT